MFRFPSRDYASAEAFVLDFMDTLTPGVIPRNDFVRWADVEQRVAGMAPYLEFYAHLADRVRQGSDFSRELADSLSASDTPQAYMECALQLLGHTGRDLVTSQDDIDVSDLASYVARGDQWAALRFAEMLGDMGFVRLLSRDDLEDLLLGVQIGLETHRRKNVGGEYFRVAVQRALERVAHDVSERTGTAATLDEEVTVVYGRALSKRVDFAMRLGRQATVGVEVNFYTVPGSKPTEIKRSYGQIREGLGEAGVHLVWITDGRGYRNMQKSLRDAYVIFPNIYNLKQAERHLADDLIALLRAG